MKAGRIPYFAIFAVIGIAAGTALLPQLDQFTSNHQFVPASGVTVAESRTPPNVNVSSDAEAWRLAAQAAYDGSTESFRTLQIAASRGRASAKFGLGLYFDHLIPTSFIRGVNGPLLMRIRVDEIAQSFPDQKSAWDRESQDLASMNQSPDVISGKNYQKQSLGWLRAAADEGDKGAMLELAKQLEAEILLSTSLLSASGISPSDVVSRNFQLEQEVNRDACSQMVTFFNGASQGEQQFAADAWFDLGVSQFLFGNTIRSFASGASGASGALYLRNTECDHGNSEADDQLVLDQLTLKAAQMGSENAISTLWSKYASQGDFVQENYWLAKLRPLMARDIALNLPNSAKLARCYIENEPLADFQKCVTSGSPPNPVSAQAAQLPSTAAVTAPAPQPNAGSKPQSLVQPISPSAAPGGGTPSYDCSRASHTGERLVCDDPGLAALDVQLASLYRQAREAAADPRELILDQRQWVEERNSCTNNACLFAIYRRRKSELERWTGGDTK